MAGRFDGLSDAGWKLFEDIFLSKEQRGRGRPAVLPGNILNSLIHILVVGCRWCDLPQGPRWASSHRRLKSWHQDGTLNEIKARPLGLAQNDGLISWTSGAADGSFSPGGKDELKFLVDIKEKIF